jgi:hypothetical protein
MTTKEKLIFIALLLASMVVSLIALFGFVKLIKFFWDFA